MNFCVGTSGYAYPKWKGLFYPAKMTPKEMLSFYASLFSSVEINNSFYKMPEAAGLEEWAGQVPADFRFTFKAPQEITHFKRLKDVGDRVAVFLEAVGVLKKRLGPLLFQLPPNFKKDLPRLREFLALMKPPTRIAMEFRHASWFDDEVYELLREHKAALCIADADDDLEIPFIATADWGYLRLRRDDYSAAALKKWAKQMKVQAWGDCFVFFKHEDTARGTQFAVRLLEVLGKD
jgi:uncharacterized protein YecE (DUF72 family)